MPRPPTVPPCPTTLGKVLPWWGKLVHRVLVAEAGGRSEAGDERTDRGGAADATGVRVRAAVNDGAGPAAPEGRDGAVPVLRGGAPALGRPRLQLRRSG